MRQTDYIDPAARSQFKSFPFYFYEKQEKGDELSG